MVGEDPEADIDPGQIPISFTHKHVLKRILIVAAGPFFNVLLAFIIFYGIFQFSGTFILRPVVGKVQENMPARVGGLQAGDEIIAINGTDVESWDDMADIVGASEGSSLAITIRREDITRVFHIAPELKKTKNIIMRL